MHKTQRRWRGSKRGFCNRTGKSPRTPPARHCDRNPVPGVSPVTPLVRVTMANARMGQKNKITRPLSSFACKRLPAAWQACLHAEKGATDGHNVEHGPAHRMISEPYQPTSSEQSARHRARAQGSSCRSAIPTPLSADRCAIASQAMDEPASC